MEFVPHQYQEYAIRFIEKHPMAILLLDMGLGKTAITLMALLSLMFDSFEVGKCLIIAPLRVARSTWPGERMKWSGFDFLRMSVVTGSAKERKAALEEPADIYVVNRDNVKWLVDYYGRSWPFDCVVIDELSSFKNHQAQRWKALKKVRHKIKRMIGLTGTPASNGLMDLWAEVGIIDEGERLGRFIGRYRAAYFRPAGMNPYTGVVFNYVLLPGADKKIYNRISDITVSMKAKDFLDMPELVTVTHEVEMNKAERKVYDTLREQMVVSLYGEQVDAANAAVLSGKLLQMANGAIYGEDGNIITIHDRKLDMLEDLIEQANGQSVLVAYWFKHDRQRIMERFPQARDMKTEQDIADWNAGKIPVAVISPASAGHGLNIQSGGHILIWMSEIWSLELAQQTTARLWRQGQTETVTVHHVICKDTVDEDVLKAIEKKDTTQSRLIDAVRAHLK